MTMTEMIQININKSFFLSIYEPKIAHDANQRYAVFVLRNGSNKDVIRHFDMKIVLSIWLYTFWRRALCIGPQHKIRMNERKNQI